MGDGPPGFRQGSSCPVVLRVPARPVPVSSTGLSPSLADLPRSFGYLPRSTSLALQPHVIIHMVWALPRSLATTSGISVLISFPEGTEMFHFPPFASDDYVFIERYRISGEFPHSEIFGSKCVCHSPKLIAAYHVLHRLLVPRHPPKALSSLKNGVNLAKNHLNQSIQFSKNKKSRSRRLGSLSLVGLG